MNTTRRFARKILEHLRKSAPRATARRLDLFQIERALKMHKKVLEEHSGTIRTRLYGGFVSNAYKWRAFGDFLTIETDPQGFTSYGAGHGTMQARPYGKGPHHIVRVIGPKQKDGRIIYKA